jgi:hypothetical protein
MRLRLRGWLRPRLVLPIIGFAEVIFDRHGDVPFDAAEI